MAVTQEGVTTQPPTLPQELVLMLLNEETGDFTPSDRRTRTRPGRHHRWNPVCHSRHARPDGS